MTNRVLFTALLVCAPVFGEQPEKVAAQEVADTTVELEACHEKIEPQLTLFHPHVMAIDDTSGEVTARFVINKAGRVENIRLLKSSGGRNARAFRNSALLALKNREYGALDKPCEHVDTLVFNLGG
ncbi:MAG: energy transducer TonB [Pseudomonadales bacterium]|nr:energy transducer TonB [Pseudomonadales bacterium]